MIVNLKKDNDIDMQIIRFAVAFWYTIKFEHCTYSMTGDDHIIGLTAGHDHPSSHITIDYVEKKHRFHGSWDINVIDLYKYVQCTCVLYMYFVLPFLKIHHILDVGSLLYVHILYIFVSVHKTGLYITVSINGIFLDTSILKQIKLRGGCGVPSPT